MRRKLPHWNDIVREIDDWKFGVADSGGTRKKLEECSFINFYFQHSKKIVKSSVNS